MTNKCELLAYKIYITYISGGFIVKGKNRKEYLLWWKELVELMLSF